MSDETTLPDDANEADALEQRRDLDAAPEGSVGMPDSAEVPDADALEQRLEVGTDEDDWR